MKIKIKGIFEKYDTEFDFNRKNTIYIGENGIGKSTTIKILNNLFKFDYIGLTKYYFDSIEIESDDETIIITYQDLTLNKEYLIKKYCENYFYDYDVYRELKQDFDLLKEQYPDISIDDLQSDNFTGDENNKQKEHIMLLLIYPFDTLCQFLNNRLLYKILKWDIKLLSNESIFKTEPRSTDYFNAIHNFYLESEKELNDGIYYKNSNIAKYHNQIKTMISKLKYKEVLMINMATDFNVTNDLNRKYVINDAEEKSLNEIYKKVIDDNKEEKSWFNRKVLVGNLFNKYDKLSNEEFIKELKNNFKAIKDIGYKDNNIDIGYYLFNNIYSDDLINEFKNDFYDYLHKKIESKELKNYNLSDKSFNKLLIYFYPLIDKNNLLNSYFKERIRDYQAEFLVSEELALIVPFYQEYKEKYFEIKNEKLQKLNNLFKKYFRNKEIIATPFGLSISTKDYINDINFCELSTGEQKIIILFLLSIFSDDLIILLDEPETSLSVVWQKELITDLEKNSNYKNLIVCTQSPFIVCDDMMKNVICLPMGDINE